MKKVAFLNIVFLVTYFQVASAQTWSPVNRPFDSIPLYRSVDFSDGNTGYLVGISPTSSAGRNRFFKSINGGNTWTKRWISPITSNMTPTAVSCSNDGNVVIIVGANGMIKRSIDGGITFQDDIHTAGTVGLGDCEIYQNMAVAVGNNGTILINPDIFSSCWYKVNSPTTVCLLSVSIGYTSSPGELIVYACGQYRTIVKGTIHDLCSLPSSTWSFIPINFGSNQNLYTAVKTILGNAKNVAAVRGSNQIIYSSDYGVTWSEISVSSNISLMSIACSTTKNYLGGYISTNNSYYHCIVKQTGTTFQSTILGLANLETGGDACGITINSNNLGYFVGESLYFYKTTGAKYGETSTEEPNSVFDTTLNFVNDRCLINDNNYAEFELLQNAPNPFSDKSVIGYNLASHNFVSLCTYDIFGVQIEKLVSDQIEVGYHHVELNAQKYHPGIFYYVFKCGKNQVSKKFIVIK
jgi:photosystem II stability/assembly factor-like uncharacterized protein